MCLETWRLIKKCSTRKGISMLKMYKHSGGSQETVQPYLRITSKLISKSLLAAWK